MKKIPYIDYKAIPEFCTINEVCRLFEVSKRELQELCETYDVQPRRNEIGEYGFVSYDVRKLHNLAYHRQVMPFAKQSFAQKFFLILFLSRAAPHNC